MEERNKNILELLKNRFKEKVSDKEVLERYAERYLAGEKQDILSLDLLSESITELIDEGILNLYSVVDIDKEETLTMGVNENSLVNIYNENNNKNAESLKEILDSNKSLRLMKNIKYEDLKW